MALGYKEVVPWLLLPESDQSEDGDRQFFDLSTGVKYLLSHCPNFVGEGGQVLLMAG